MKKKLFALLLTVIIVVGVGLASFAYSGFVSGTIYEESTAHLVEIFHQANQALYNMVSVNWSRMRMWTPFIEKANIEQEVVEYVNQARDESISPTSFSSPATEITSRWRGRRDIWICGISSRI